tara:strand:+ start:6858 stop:7223 length:366 start_codon:yes stop_codon:yes gene_type:complete
MAGPQVKRKLTKDSGWEHHTDTHNWWNDTDSQLIDYYTNRKTGKIAWDNVESGRMIRDENTGSGKYNKKFADLDESWYDWGSFDKNRESPSAYPIINRETFGKVENKILDAFNKRSSRFDF